MAESANKKVRLVNRSGGGERPEPIILEYKRKKKTSQGEGTEEKEQYSKGLEDIQRLEGNLLRVSQKAAKALSKGIDTYQNERQKSSEEKTDGAVEDCIHNSAKAASTYMKEASDITVDI